MQPHQQHSAAPHDAPQPVVHFRGSVYTPEQARAWAMHEYQQKNLQLAAALYHSILAATPGDADSAFNRGRVLRDLHLYHEALASYAQAMTLLPDHPLIPNNVGNTLQEMGHFAEALESYDRALALKPDYFEAYVNRGSALQELNCAAEALASYDHAIALNPECAEVYNNRGTILHEMHRYAEAVASYDRAVALKPDYGEAYNNRGNALVSIGAMAEAELMYRKAHALKPDFPDPLCSITHIQKYHDPDHPDATAIRRLLGIPDTSARNREQLYFALGKIYDDCGCYDDAFEAYRQANLIRNASAAYNHQQVRRITDRMIEVFRRDVLARPLAGASQNRAPIFIVGMPRSGTTLMASILSNHHAVDTAGELPTIAECAARCASLSGNGSEYPEAVLHLTPDGASLLSAAYLQRLRRDSDPAVLYTIDKFPPNFRHLGLIAALFPNAHIIHCIREPLDVSLSNYFQRFSLTYDYAFDLQNIASYYEEYTRLMAHWRNVLPIPMLEVRYEEMVANTEQTIHTMLDFLGLPWDAKCLAPHTNPYAVETASNWQVRQPIHDQSIGRWRHYQKHLGALHERLQRAR